MDAWLDANEEGHEPRLAPALAGYAGADDSYFRALAVGIQHPSEIARDKGLVWVIPPGDPDLVGALRANPKAALQAVREAKIAGPWRSAGTLADGRYTLEGREAYTISILSELHPHCPTRSQLDQAAKDAGWILVDG